MKKLNIFALCALIALASLVAFAAPANVNMDGNVRWMKLGFWVMPPSIGGQTVAANKVTRMLGTSSVQDFASATITCVDSAGITLTGAQAGDPCFVGAPTTIAANTSFTCYVSAADTVKIRYCPAGTAADPPSGTYFVRVISSQ